jgi:tetratricopeptide (TPR) repeat protein
MALANVAARYAQRGKRVLALDFDFEAPGLHRYFLKPERYAPAGPQSGVLNLFASLRDQLRTEFPGGRGIQEEDAPAKLRALVAGRINSGEYLYKVQLTDPNTRPARMVSVDFVAAARFDATYSELVRTFDWQGFYDDYAEVFSALVEELASRYDVILVDSRTGVTDIGSICTMVLPDKLVLVFTPNEQSLVGALDAGWQAVQGRKDALEPRKLPIFPLVSRIEEGEEQQKREWIRRAREGFEKLVREAYGVTECDLETYFNVVRVPHRGYYSYGERIAAEEQSVSESGSLAQLFDWLADCLKCAGVMEAQLALLAGDEQQRRDAHRATDVTDVLIKVLEASRLTYERPSDAVRAYDDIMPRLMALRVQGMPGDMVLQALRDKAHALSLCGRFEESVEVYQEVLRLFGDDKTDAASATVDQATHDLGIAFEKLGLHEDALRAQEQVLARLEGRTDAHAKEGIARALFAKGTILRSLSKTAEAVRIYDRLLTEFQQSTDPRVETLVLKALVNKGVGLTELGDEDAANAVREDVVRRFKESANVEHREAVAVAWLGKLATDVRQGNIEAVVDACDEMIRHFSDAREPAILRPVAAAMIIKSAALETLGRQKEALSALDDLLARVGDVPARELDEPLARALVLKRLYLRDAGRPAEARTVRDELVRRYGDGPEGDSQSFAVEALMQEAQELANSREFTEALATVEDFLSRFSGGQGRRMRKANLRVLMLRGFVLGELGRQAEAAASYDKTCDRLKGIDEPDLQDLIPRALNGAGFARLCLAKQTWHEGDSTAARALLEQAASNFAAALAVTPEEPLMLGNAAYSAFLLGREDEARELLTKAIALGGAAVREAELKDADIFPLSQDDAFRVLVRSIPDAPPPATRA